MTTSDDSRFSPGGGGHYSSDSNGDTDKNNDGDWGAGGPAPGPQFPADQAAGPGQAGVPSPSAQHPADPGLPNVPGWGPAVPVPTQFPAQMEEESLLLSPPPVIPFRPLTVGNLFEGAFAAIRSNPKVMFTISLVTMGIIGLLSGLFTAAFTPSAEELITSGWLDDTQAVDVEVDVTEPLAGLFAEFGLSITTALATLLVGGMLVLSITNAVVGAAPNLSQTWAELKPHFWRLIGTALLVSLILAATVVALTLIPLAVAVFLVVTSDDNWAWLWLAGVGLIATMVVAAWLTVRLYFATTVTVVEGASPGSAIRRSWKLTAGAFWVTFGRAILISIVVGAAVSIVGGIVGVVGALALSFAAPWVSALALSVIASLVAGAALPLSASYGALMYVDRRLRTEDLAPRLEQALLENRMEQGL